eukprot:TRINITY_DN6242_c0_g1_i2.p1 TRINITY_DN6242_c0_g1~~TRINITY_DN6242_c0_g1_i2.p1  ORF type:complete len:145 (-),score=14.68 TRINITY_DN6242_c0_g1_i2:68-502(-)
MDNQEGFASPISIHISLGPKVQKVYTAEEVEDSDSDSSSSSSSESNSSDSSEHINYPFQHHKPAQQNYNDSKVCDTCGATINPGTPYLQAIGRFYHDDCFNCNLCSRNLNGQYVNIANAPYCQNCSPKVKPKYCSVCNQVMENM